MSQKSYDGKNALYIIPTPIGNLDDITLRSIKVLKEIDLLFAEDTRVAKNLLNHLDISKKVLSSHEYNEDKNLEKLKKYLESGINIGIITDRGTPIISDPGYELARYAIKCGFKVISLPGATALIPALTSSGLNPAPFMFVGFLKEKGEKIKKELLGYQNIKATLIFYESPHRLVKTLKVMQSVLGDRNICVAREISKKYEEYYRGLISEVLLELNDEIKGEIVIVVSGNYEKTNYDDLTIIEHIKLYLEDGTTSNEAIKKVAKERNLVKSVVYQEYLKNK